MIPIVKKVYYFIFRQRVREKFHGLSYLFEIVNQIMLSRSEPVAAADSGRKSFA